MLCEKHFNAVLYLILNLRRLTHYVKKLRKQYLYGNIKTINAVILPIPPPAAPAREPGRAVPGACRQQKIIDVLITEA